MVSLALLLLLAAAALATEEGGGNNVSFPSTTDNAIGKQKYAVKLIIQPFQFMVPEERWICDRDRGRHQNL